MRPTGKLHLGNYMGALHNWVRLQNDPQYECYFFIADWHALTTDYADPSQIAANTREVILDYLAAGLDPAKSVLFVQSDIKQHAELHLLLSMITSVGWLERVPTYKEQKENLKDKDLSTYGFLGYPLLQSADILLYRPAFVPVGQDQVAHVELTREVARRFNFFYGPGNPRRSRFEGPGVFPLPLRQNLEHEFAKKGMEFKGAHFQDFPPNDLAAALTGYKILPEPEVLLTPSPKLPGTDGRKMSKSYGNTILLTDSFNTVSMKLREMDKGGQRTQLADPGDPDKCPVADLHMVFSNSQTLQRILDGCRNASIPCIECKQLAANSIWQRELQEIQTRRSQFELKPHLVDEILANGAEKARTAAEATMADVRKAMGLCGGQQHFDLTRFEQFKQDIPNSVIYDLSSHREWWDLEKKSERGDRLREYMKAHMLPQDIQLRRLSDRVFVTPRNKRVLVPTSRQHLDRAYRFDIPNKSYEVLLLLAWEMESYVLRPFVVPQKEFRTLWTRIDRSLKEFQAFLRKSDTGYSLEFPHSPPIDVTRYEGDFTALR
jgi:tryptophanyl-tRNA synthetase